MDYMVLFMDGDISRNIVFLGLYIDLFLFEYQNFVKSFCTF